MNRKILSRPIGHLWQLFNCSLIYLLQDDERAMTSARNAQVMNEHSYSTFHYKPLHVQRAEKLLGLDHVVKSTESVLQDLDNSDDEL